MGIYQVVVVEADYTNGTEYERSFYVQSFVSALAIEGHLRELFVRTRGNMGKNTRYGDIRSIHVKKVDVMNVLEIAKAIEAL